LVVGPEVLDVARGHVADRVTAPCVDGIDRRGVHHEGTLAGDVLVHVEVDVVDLGRDAWSTGEGHGADVHVDAAGRLELSRVALELILPARVEGRCPAGPRVRIAGDR